jgi:NitT/TauT family transport system ATP-binding protein
MTLNGTEGPLIRLSAVGKTFARKGSVTQALVGVDLEIRRGEFVSLLGPSGCGKSTLLRVIGGLLEADRGEVTVEGEQPVQARAEKRFGLVPQVPALLPWRTVADNVRLLTQVNRNGGDHRALSETQVTELIEAVGLSKFTHSMPHELSGGMQQRVSLVRAFSLGAPILLMDEPFASLDEITRADMRYLLLDLWERSGATVVFVTHSINEAVILSDRVVMLAARPGRVVAIEPIDLGRPRTPETEDDPVFHAHVSRLRHALREGHAR